jgi:hypothetical protein
MKTSRYNFTCTDQIEAIEAQPTPAPTPTPAPAKPAVNALDFLKSRPQVAAMNQIQNDRPQKRAAPPAPAPPSKAAKTQTPDTDSFVYKKVIPPAHDLGTLEPIFPSSSRSLRSDSWQPHETILEFLRRLPVADPNTARVGPWLWVRCSSQLQDRANDKDLNSFLETATPLLEGLLKQRVIIEQQNPGKAVGTITRKLGPYRDQLEVDQLEVDLFNTATKHGVTSSKWMLFPKLDDLPRVWRLVAEATAEGKLGPTSKVGTWTPEDAIKGCTLICVYTRDFSDLVDVKRVLSALVELGISKRESTIYYKCDAYTHLDIKSGNDYKLRASLYSSEEVLEDKVKYREGVIIRLKKSAVLSDLFA